MTTPKRGPMLMISPMSGIVYIVTRYKDRGEGRFEAITKYAVPEAEVRAILRVWETVHGKTALPDGGGNTPKTTAPTDDQSR